MQRAQWVLGALALVLVIALALLLAGRFGSGRDGTATPTPTATPLSASVAAVTGAVFACPAAPVGDCNAPASVGQTVLAGGEVRTGDSGTADVQTHTTVFRLENNTLVRFRDVTDAVTQVVLAVGRLFASHDPGGRSVVRVQVGQVTIQAIDTRFSVEAVANGGVYVAVPPGGGQVTILSGPTASLPLMAGEEIFITPGINVPPAPRPISPDEQARWAVVGCAWQQIAARLTPVALPPAQCASPTPSPTATPHPPTATPRPARPSATPIVLPTATPIPPTVPGEPLATPTLTPALPPGRTLSAYLATWLNTGAQSTGPPKLTITNKGATLIVQWFQLCAPHLCAGASTTVLFSGEPVAILSPQRHRMRITLDKAGAVLTLEDTDSKTRDTYRQATVQDYSGTWRNDDFENSVLPRLVIRNSGRRLVIDWSSGCFVANCSTTVPFSSEPITSERFVLRLDDAAGTRLQVADLAENATYYFHK
jgi:hypothetical protein